MYRLVIGNKNYSSWSLRAWLLMSEALIPFEEIPLALGTAAFTAEIGGYTPTGRVPVLLDTSGPEPFAVWDTLAIAEYLAEAEPDRQLWPGDRHARARARSMCAEMHAGFSALRSALPMNVAARLPGFGWSVVVQDDIDRLVAMWRACLARYGGPLLFGRFSVADAFFAPVVSRFATYAIELPPDIAAFRDRVLALDGMRAWAVSAAGETAFIAADEPYRRAR